MFRLIRIRRGTPVLCDILCKENITLHHQNNPFQKKHWERIEALSQLRKRRAPLCQTDRVNKAEGLESGSGRFADIEDIKAEARRR
jgi:hypothetical protein